MATGSSEYVAFSSQSQFTCPDATEHDKCILSCDQDEGKTPYEYTFDCGNAGICEFHCDGIKCFESGTLNAANSNQLIVTSSASECLRKATVNAPDSGTASFSMSDEKSFKEMTVNAGTNTQSIEIDCTFGTGDECKDLIVNAESAEYLEITVGADSELDSGSIINCPQHSPYQGPERAPCIVDASNGGIIKSTTINTLNGIPTDVWIKTGPISLSKVEITCTAGLSMNDGNIFDVQSDCWITAAPTISPTFFPIAGPVASTTLTSAVPATANPTNSPTTTLISTTDIFTPSPTLINTVSSTTVDDLQFFTSTMLKETHSTFTTSEILREAAVDHEETTMYTTSASLLSAENATDLSRSSLLSVENGIYIVLVSIGLLLCFFGVFKFRRSRYMHRSEETTRPKLSVQVPAVSSDHLPHHHAVHLAVPSKGSSVFSEVVRREVVDEKGSYDDLPMNSPRIWNTPTGDTYHDEDCGAFKDELDDINNSQSEILQVCVTDRDDISIIANLEGSRDRGSVDDDFVEHCGNADEDVVEIIDNIGGTPGGGPFID